MGIADKLDEWLRDTDLNEEQLIDLGSIYSIMQKDHHDLMEVSFKHGITVAQAYWECERAKRLIAERVRKMRQERKE